MPFEFGNKEEFLYNARRAYEIVDGILNGENISVDQYLKAAEIMLNLYAHEEAMEAFDANIECLSNIPASESTP